MPSISEIIYMKMTNGEYIYGTNLDIGKYSVKENCECEVCECVCCNEITSNDGM